MQSENKQIAILLAVTALFLLIGHKDELLRRFGSGLASGSSTGQAGNDDAFVLRGSVTYEDWQ